MPTTLDILEKATGETAGPDLLDALRLFSDDEVDALVEQVLAEPVRPRSAPPENEVWPLIGARTSTFTAGGSNTAFIETAGAAGINLFAAVDPRFRGTGRFSGSLLRALLYSHGLVIEDPLALAADMFRGTSKELRALARTAVEAGAESLCEIATLVEAGVVETFFGRPDSTAEELTQFIQHEVDASTAFDTDMLWDTLEAEYVSQLDPRLQQLWRQIRAGNRNPPTEPIEEVVRDGEVEMVETFIKVVADLRPSAVVDNAIGVVAEALADAQALGGRYDLLCPTSLFAQLLFIGEADPVDALRVRELARIEIPGIENLLLEDVVAIRQASEAFALWRTRLSFALERAHRLRDEVGSVDAHAAVAEALAEARSNLFREFEQSMTLRARLGGPVQFVAGALAGGAGGLAGGVAGAAVGAGATVLPPLLGRLIGGRAIPGFLRRHYLVFEPARR